MDYCFHICTRAFKSSESSKSFLWTCGRGKTYFQLRLSHRRDVASLSLFYCLFYSNSSNELSLVFPVQTFATKTHLATSTESNHPHSLRISIIRRSSTQLLSKNCYFGEQIPAWLLPWTIKCYLLLVKDQSLSWSSSLCIHVTRISFSYPQRWMVFWALCLVNYSKKQSLPVTRCLKHQHIYIKKTMLFMNSRVIWEILFPILILKTL